MDFLDQNLDAYRIIAEILNDLRTLVQKTLQAKHGKEWYRTGLPSSVFDRLIEVKEQEKAIDWYETEYQKIINYALFPELLEIAESDPEAFAPLFKLAPSAALLNARFLELEVMRAKLGRARPVSESELSFLSTFHIRFRKATGDLREAVSGSAPPTSSGETDSELAVDEITDEMPVEPPPEPADHEGSLPEDASTAESTHDEEPESETVSETPPTTAPATPRIAPPRRPVQMLHSSRASTAAAVAPVAAPDHEEEESQDESQEEPDSTRVARGSLSQALEDSDSKAILRELYREVTTLAESIWSSDVPPGAMVWQQVRSSSWYEVNFSKLGLKPLSDFYDVFSSVESKLEDGVARDQLQDYLKEVNFAQILLAMRDMFQRNHI
jgi:hypothetical protein